MNDVAPSRALPVIAVVGPTAAGKTAVGVALAERLGGEIVSADAVAVYRGFDIGSAKPDAGEKARARFHLIDVAGPDEDYTVADFERQAEAAIADIRSRGRLPLVVGGTGLYVRAITAKLTVPNVAPQEEFRAALQAETDEHGAPALHARLMQVDPAAAAKILPGDARRIIRALEVYEVTGRPFSSFHTPEGVRGVPRPDTYVFAVTREREELYARVDARVDAMMAAGFLDEVRGLLADGYGPGLKSMQSLGYKHLARHLTAGQPLGEAVEELKRDTRRFAKRQLSWFRSDPGVRLWHTMMETTSAEDAAERLAEEARSLLAKAPASD